MSSKPWKLQHGSMVDRNGSESTMGQNLYLVISISGLGSMASCSTTHALANRPTMLSLRVQQSCSAGMFECILVLEPRRCTVQNRGVAGRIQYYSPAQRDRPSATRRARNHWLQHAAANEREADLARSKWSNEGARHIHEGPGRMPRGLGWAQILPWVTA